MIFRQQTMSAALAAAALSVLVASPASAQLLGPASTTTATQLKWVSDEPGHQLVTPYFSTQGDNNTLLSYVNTDRVNGKLLKVRFRGAANGDALLDFMVLLAPGDVWTASLSQGPDGITRIISPDGSCTLPGGMAAGVAFSTARLQAELSASAKASHTREGLVEAINMADVVPGTSLFGTISHPGRGTAPCAPDQLAPLASRDRLLSDLQAERLGLAPPSGGLMGNWQIIRLSNYASYSGRQDAIVALDAQGKHAVANWAFSPQLAENANAGKAHTTDPVLVANGLQWTDLPDLSTPMFGTSASDYLQALDGAGRVDAVMNEFVAPDEDAPVPAATDWVLSQPLRRYIVAWDDKAKHRLFAPGYEYRNVTTTVMLSATGMGHTVCLRGRYEPATREAQVEDSVGFPTQPPKPGAIVCGAVAVLAHMAADSKVLQSQLATPVSAKYGGKPMEAGWAQYSFSRAMGAPGLTMLGYAATSLRNKDQNGNYGSVVPHVRLRD